MDITIVLTKRAYNLYSGALYTFDYHFFL